MINLRLLVLLLVLLIACGPSTPAPTTSKTTQITEQRALALALQLLQNRGLEQGFSHDGAVYLPVRFDDGEDGVFIAIGYSGPVRGFSILGKVQSEQLEVLELRKDQVDWGIHSLREPTAVPAETIALTLDPRRGPETVLKVTGTLHEPTFLDDEGYFELLRLGRKRIEVLFVGSAKNDFMKIESGRVWTDHRYEFQSSPGRVSEIIETRSECRASRARPSTPECRDHRVDHRFNGQAFVETK